MKQQKLTLEEELLVSNYLLDRNVRFTSQRTAIPVRRCYYLLRKEHVETEISQRARDIAERCDITAEQVLNEIARIAFYDIKQHIKTVRTNVIGQIEDNEKQKEDHETFLELQDWDEIDGRAIAEITEKYNKDGLPEIKIKAHSKMEALKVLAEWFKGGHGEGQTNIQINVNDLKGKSAQEVAADYQSMINGD